MTRTRAASLSTLMLTLDGALAAVSALAAWVLHAQLRPMLPWLESTPPWGMLAAFILMALPVHLLLTVTLGLHRAVERGLHRTTQRADAQLSANTLVHWRANGVLAGDGHAVYRSDHADPLCERDAARMYGFPEFRSGQLAGWIVTGHDLHDHG